MQPSTICFIPIARATFDVPYAREKTQQARQHLAQAGITLHALADLVMDADGVLRALDLLRANEFDLLVILQASFADSTMVRELVANSSAPVLLWAVPEPRVGGRLRLNSFCGVNLAAHSLKRAGLRYHSLLAEPTSDEALQTVRTLATAANVKKRLQGARIGRFGENPQGFETCLFDADNLKRRLGVEVVQVALPALFERVRGADAAQVTTVEAQVRETLSGYEDVDNVAARATLATYVTFRQMAEGDKLNGLAVRCWPEFFTELGCSACGAMSMMSDASVPASCEADVNGTITQLLLQWVSGEAAFGSDLVDFDVADDTAVLWHCGLAPLAMADPDAVPEAALHSNRQKPLLYQFPLKPGRVTLARLSEASGELRLVVASGQMLKRPPAFTGTSGTLRFDSGAQHVMNAILEQGLEHHIAVTYGDHIDTLIALASMLELPVYRL